MLNSTYRNYYLDVSHAFLQYQFFSAENQQLESSAKLQLQFCVSKPKLRLFFAVPIAAAKPELARVLFVFSKLFFVKPFVSRVSDTSYHVYATLGSYRFSRVISLLLRLKRLNNSKFLTFCCSDDATLRINLAEPLTFFPLVHPNFDYHDWNYPFTFELALDKPVQLESVSIFNTFFAQ